MDQNFLDIRNLSCGYTKELCRLGDIQLRARGLVSLLGNNGSGKSTLLKTLSGFLTPLSGSLTIFGDDLFSLPVRRRAEYISVVNTERPLLPGFTSEDVILLHQNTGSDSASRLEEIVVGLKLESLIHKLFSELSDGERQLILVARALHQDGKMVLMDEPSSFLDYKNKRILFSFLKKWSEKRLVICATHDIDMADEFSDGLWLIEAGAVVIWNGKSWGLEKIKQSLSGT